MRELVLCGAALCLAAVLLCGRNAHTFGVTIPAHGSLSLDTRSAALRVAITAAADWAVSVTTTEVVGACARCAAAVPELRGRRERARRA